MSGEWRAARTESGNPGRPTSPVPFTHEDVVIQLKICPHCNGRGWFLINPFATGGRNGAGGIGNMTQCLTCKSAKEHFDAHGVLPPEMQELFEAKFKGGAA